MVSPHSIRISRGAATAARRDGRLSAATGLVGGIVIGAALWAFMLGLL